MRSSERSARLQGAYSCRPHGGGPFDMDEIVDLREEGGRIVIVPVRPGSFDLEELLSGITPENLHAEVDFGGAMGKEVL